LECCVERKIRDVNGTVLLDLRFLGFLGTSLVRLKALRDSSEG
jgi:hypothetical protein